MCTDGQLRAVARIGDSLSCGCKIMGGGTITAGSPTVTADGKAIARIGDMLSCGCMITGGGNTVGGGANG